MRTLFQGLFESFLTRREVSIHRLDPIICPRGHPLNRAVVRELKQDNVTFSFCTRCGERVQLVPEVAPIDSGGEQAVQVSTQTRTSDRRTVFEQAIFRLGSYVSERKIAAPDCFVSYAWGNEEFERWVERQLATDLIQAGIPVVLDRWENARIGASLPRFVERIGKCARVVVVGTPQYRQKYENNEKMRGFVVAAEGDLIGWRMLGSEAEKESVLPVLFSGSPASSFPEILRPRVFADFRNKDAYFTVMFGLIVTLYGLSPKEPIVAELSESRRG